MQGIIKPDGPFGKDIIENMAQTQQGYLGLINWANNLLIISFRKLKLKEADEQF